MYVTSGNFFKPNGTATFTYGNGTLHLFSSIRWSAAVPAGTAVRARTRVANDVADLPYATWSSYMTSSGSTVDLPIPGSQYKYIQIETLLESSGDRRSAPQLVSLMLDSVFYGAEFGFTFDSQDAWESGTSYNVDTSTVPGGITIGNLSDVGSYVLGTDGSVVQLDSSYLQTLAVYGSSAPKSMNQMRNGGSGFGKLTSVDTSPEGGFLVCDPENDRILEISRDGRIEWGLSGMYSYDPTGSYPYSVPVDSSGAAATESTEDKRSMSAIGCYYDEDKKRLSVFFNEDLSDIYQEGNIDLSKIVVTAGTRVLRLGYRNCTPSLFGIDREHSGISDLPDTFFGSSNVLLLDIAGPDAVALSTSAYSTLPYIVITNPVRNAVVSAGAVQVDFSVGNAVFGTDCGISLSIDGGVPVLFYDIPTYTFQGLSGAHTIVASLVDMSGNLLAGAQVSTSLSFYADPGGYSDPHLKVVYPFDNQQVSYGLLPVGLQFLNLPAGTKLKVSIDGGAQVLYPLVSTLSLYISGGRHSVRILLTNSSGIPLAGEFSEDTFNVDVYGIGGVPVSITVGRDAVKSYAGQWNLRNKVNVAFTPIAPANVYCPIDARYSVDGSSVGNGSYDVVVAKIGVKSYPNYYVASASAFVDGSSVVEFRRDGSVGFSVPDIELVRSRTDAMEFLGSVCKASSDVVLVGDSAGRQALVVSVDRNAAASDIVWAYESDRRVSDFAKFEDAYKNIGYDQDGLSASDLSVPSGTVVTWTNNGTANIRIMSGSTDPESFAKDPDLSLYGAEFDSGVVAPGESFTFTFLNNGYFDYFVWPAIDTGNVTVSSYPVSIQDKFVIVENDPVSSSYSSRVIVVDSWGNVEWSFGDSIVRRIKDARPSGESGIIITV
jgi:plastocyanin